MIPRAYINAWRKFAPWKTNEQVETDLIPVIRAGEKFDLDKIFNRFNKIFSDRY